MSDRRAIGFLTLAILFITLPFLHRPYFVDDYYFVVMAKGILADPWRPYDFRSDDAGKNNPGWERGQPPRMVNPPLFHYYLAAIMRVFGEKVWVLRASLIPFSWLAVVAMYFLGRRLGQNAFWAALLMTFTPIFWLTSYSLLIDSMLVAFVLGGLWLFLKAHDQADWRCGAVAGLVLGLGMLVKYFGVIGMVLALVWGLLQPRRLWSVLAAALAVFMMLQIGWAVWNLETYGSSHLLASAARGVKAGEGVLFYLYKSLNLGSFLSGGCAFLLFSPILLWRQSRILVLAAVVFAAVLFGLFQSRAGGFVWAQSLQLSLWISASLTFLISLFLLGWPAEMEKRFIRIWLLLGFLELFFVMPWTAGRYFLCTLPALCWLFAEILHRTGRWNWRRPILAFTVLTAGLAAWGDYAQARTITQLAASIKETAPHRYYLGDTFSGFKPYLEPLGWEAAFPNQSFEKGDLLLYARCRLSAWWHLPDALPVERVHTYTYGSALPIRVMNIAASAGWYASVWGALPYAITREPLEEFLILKVTAKT